MMKLGTKIKEHLWINIILPYTIIFKEAKINLKSINLSFYLEKETIKSEDLEIKKLI